MNTDVPTPCLNNHSLFLSPEPADHEQAKIGCLGNGDDVPACHRLEWCKSEAKESLKLRPHSLEGTWHGVLYVDKRRKPAEQTEAVA